MITEEAVPLQVSLEDSDSGKSDYAISWGIHQTLVSDNTLVSYTGNFGTGNFGTGKMANHEPFAKIFLTNIHS